MVLSGQGDPAGFKTPELKHSVWSVIDVIVEIERAYIILQFPE